MNTSVRDPDTIRVAWRDLAAQHLRQRDVAMRLAISEAELLDSCVGQQAGGTGPSVTRLEIANGGVDALIEKLPTLGRVMALTRNESCVHEKDGVYENLDLSGHAGLVLGKDIDLRLFHRRWRFGYAASEVTPRGPQRSLQFFLEDGVATHKIFLRPDSNVAAFDALSERFRHAVQTPGITADPPEEADANEATGAGEIDVGLFQADWLAMTDTHEFFGLLKRHGVSRTRAMALAPPGHAVRVDNQSAQRMLENAAAQQLSIMVFVGNPGCIQIHTGPVRLVKVMDRWLNVLDPGFNLHLRSDLIEQSWIVRKPTADGEVTSLELFDAQGDTIAMFFGERKPGKPELGAWRALARTLQEHA